MEANTSLDLNLDANHTIFDQNCSVYAREVERKMMIYLICKDVQQLVDLSDGIYCINARSVVRNKEEIEEFMTSKIPLVICYN